MLFGHKNRPFLSTCSEPRNGVSVGKVKKNSAVIFSSSRHKNALTCTVRSTLYSRRVLFGDGGGGKGVIVQLLPLERRAGQKWMGIKITTPPARRRKWQPTPVLLPGKFHGWKSLVGYSSWGRKESDTTSLSSFCSSFGHGLGWTTGVGDGQGGLEC